MLASKLKTTLFLLCLTNVTTVFSQSFTLPTTQPATELIELPIEKMSAVQRNGRIVFISDNGRFVIKGQLYDLWSKRKLTTMPDIKVASERILFKEYGMDIDSLNTLTIGGGENEVVIFTDPLCSVCHKLLSETELLLNDFTFKIVVIPALGEESHRLSKALFCAKNREDAYSSLMNLSINELDQKASCDLTNYDKTLMTSHFLGIKGVPFIVATDGRVSRGKPGDLKAWLEGGL